MTRVPVPGGETLNPTVSTGFDRALELQVPDSYFTAEMVTSFMRQDGNRPVDLLPVKPLISAVIQNRTGIHTEQVGGVLPSRFCRIEAKSA
jgi:hypothetical protein